MPYIGKSPLHGNYSKLDDFSGDFDGSDATHALATNGLAVTPVTEAALLISINGVIQEPVTAYTVSGTNITFTSAPASTDTFYGVALGEQLAIGTPSDSTITSAKLSGNLVTPGTLDVNGQELILDADADTSITADTDDQIDIKIAGADDFQFTANTFTVLSGSTLAIASGATIANSGTSTGFSLTGIDDQTSSNDDQLTITDSAIIINEDGDDVDFRIESDTNTNAFHVNSGLFSGVGSIGIGRAADSTVDVLVGNAALTATADASHYRMRLVPAGAVTIPSGTAAEVATLSVFEPNITATGTVTTAASLWVHSAPTEATNNYALYVDDGASKFDGDVTGLTLNATGDTAAGDNAAIGYTAAEGLILTGQGSTDDITIKNDADTTIVNVATGGTDIEISAGDLFFGTSGKGIVLGATTNTDANTLSDYETGTWTPVPRFNANSIQHATSASYGIYRKFNDTVIVDAYINYTISGTGHFNISGLPFGVNTQNNTHPCTGSSMFNDYGGNRDTIGAFANGESVLYYYLNPADATTQLAGMTHSQFGATSQNVRFSGIYYTSS